MMQIEKDKVAHHLLEGLKLKKVLLQIRYFSKDKICANRNEILGPYIRKREGQESTGSSLH